VSATNRGAIRAERDYYRTPNWAAHACVDALGYTVDAKTTFMDPCAGDGVFGDAVLALSPESFLVEIDILFAWQQATCLQFDESCGN
jgi:hypothetical protein